MAADSGNYDDSGYFSSQVSSARILVGCLVMIYLSVIHRSGCCGAEQTFQQAGIFDVTL